MTDAGVRSPTPMATLEAVEIKALIDFHRAATPALEERCGLQLVTAGTAVAAVVKCADVLALNRLVGFGLESVADDADLDRLLGVYGAAGVPRFFVQVAPGGRDPSLPDRLRARNLRHYNNWVKLERDVTPLPPVPSDLRVAQIDHRHGSDFARIVAESFGWPAEIQPWIAQSVGRPQWRHYLAFADTKPVATAALFVTGKYGWIDFTATLPEYRGRGAQSKLLEVRIADATAQGCERLVVETAQQTAAKEAPSYRNMIRYGFQEAYVRPNYIWES